MQTPKDWHQSSQLISLIDIVFLTCQTLHGWFSLSVLQISKTLWASPAQPPSSTLFFCWHVEHISSDGSKVLHQGRVYSRGQTPSAVCDLGDLSVLHCLCGLLIVAYFIVSAQLATPPPVPPFGLCVTLDVGNARLPKFVLCRCDCSRAEAII